MDGLGDDGGDDEQHGDDTANGETGTVNPNGTAEMLQCLYEDLYGITKPTKAQVTATGERERPPAEVETDVKRAEEELLGATPPPQDF